MVVDEAFTRVPVLSSAHTVPDPSPAVNSSAPYSTSWPAIEPDHVKVTVEEPVVVTVPYQISLSDEPLGARLTALCQVVTPPPDTDDKLMVDDPPWAKTTSTSPAVLGDTPRVVSPVPLAEVIVPTAVMEATGVVKVNWSTVGLAAEVPPGAVTNTSTVEAPSAGEVAVMEVAELTVTMVPATVPNLTAVAPVKLVPVMVTVVPPAVVPVLGLTPVTVGAGGGAPFEALRNTATDDEVPAGVWGAVGATVPETPGS